MGPGARGRRGLAASFFSAATAWARRKKACSAPRPARIAAPDLQPEVPALTMANGLGGFSSDGKEYVVVLEGDRETPVPWANVIANSSFGTVVTSSGSSFTWSENSRENRLTPFANDPV